MDPPNFASDQIRKETRGTKTSFTYRCLHACIHGPSCASLSVCVDWPSTLGMTATSGSPKGIVYFLGTSLKKTYYRSSLLLRLKPICTWWLCTCGQWLEADIELAIPRGGQHKGFRPALSHQGHWAGGGGWSVDLKQPHVGWLWHCISNSTCLWLYACIWSYNLYGQPTASLYQWISPRGGSDHDSCTSKPSTGSQENTAAGGQTAVPIAATSKKPRTVSGIPWVWWRYLYRWTL